MPSMSTMTILAKMHATHDPHRNDPNQPCDACRLLEMLDKQREAIQRVLEWNSKGQYDQAAFSQTLQDGLGR